MLLIAAALVTICMVYMVVMTFSYSTPYSKNLDKVFVGMGMLGVVLMMLGIFLE